MKRYTRLSKSRALLLFSLLQVSFVYSQDWLSPAQKNPIPGQTRIFYNACTDEQAFVSDNTKKWAQSGVRAGQKVTLQLLGVNPFYKQTIKFNKASFSWKTPEPENFQLTKPTSTSSAKDASVGGSNSLLARLNLIVGRGGNEERTVAGARGLVENKINTLERKTKKIPAIENDIVILNQLLGEAERIENETADAYKALAGAESQVADAFTVLESIIGFQNSLTISPCLTIDDYTRQETTLLNSLTAYLDDATVVNNAGKLANAFRYKIEAYPNTYDLIKIRQRRLQKDADNLRARIQSLSTSISKSAAEALADETDSTIDGLSDILDNKESAVDSLKKQLAGEEGEKLKRVCQTLLNNKTYFTTPVVLGPFNPDRNANEISVAATAIRPAADGRESAEVSLIDLSLPIVTNIQIDFTTGGLFSSLGDNAFVVQTIPSSTTATPDTYAIQTNRNRGGFVLATQANLIWQTSPSFGWGANIGVGVDVVNNQSARYMMGLSSKFGGLSDNIIVSAGVILGKVKRLSAELSPDISYQKQIEPKTYDKFEAGFYVGVSYVLGSKKVKK